MAARFDLTVNFRMSRSLMARVDKALKHERRHCHSRPIRTWPYATSRSDVLRLAIDLGLTALKQHRPDPNPSRGMIKT